MISYNKPERKLPLGDPVLVMVWNEEALQAALRKQELNHHIFLYSNSPIL
jgi:hypothetical protein